MEVLAPPQLAPAEQPDPRIEPCIRDRDVHCPHIIDEPTTDSTYEVRCCFCNTTRHVSYEIREAPSEGHGPHEPKRYAVIHWPVGWRD